MKWARILVAGIGTSVAVLLVITLVVTGYAFKLAFEVRGRQTRLGLGSLPGTWVVRSGGSSRFS
jgi:hypothetical protein